MQEEYSANRRVLNDFTFTVYESVRECKHCIWNVVSVCGCSSIAILDNACGHYDKTALQDTWRSQSLTGIATVIKSSKRSSDCEEKLFLRGNSKFRYRSSFAKMEGTQILTSDKYRQIILTKLNSSDFRIVSIDEFKIAERVGFLGDHSQIKIKVSTSNNSSEEKVLKEFALFVKSMPVNSIFRELIEESKIFEKEGFFYNKIAKDLSPITSQVTFPAAYWVDSGVVVLEDMREHGYSAVSSTTKPVDRQHCEQALRALARLHSASIVMENRSKRCLKDLYPEILHETVFVTKGKWSSWIDAGFRAARDLIPYLPRYENNPSVALKIQEQFNGIKDVYVNFLKRYRDTALVICHGDAWISNFIFKYEKNIPIQAVLVDFQVIRLAPPAFDVMLFLHKSLGCDDRRSKDMEDLVDFYYSSLQTELLLSDIDIQSVLTKSDYLQTCKDFQFLMSMMTTLYADTIDVPTEFIDGVWAEADLYNKYVLLDRSEDVVHFFKTDLHFRTVKSCFMQELVDHLCRRESLQS